MNFSKISFYLFILGNLIILWLFYRLWTNEILKKGINKKYVDQKELSIDEKKEVKKFENILIVAGLMEIIFMIYH